MTRCWGHLHRDCQQQTIAPNEEGNLLCLERVKVTAAPKILKWPFCHDSGMAPEGWTTETAQVSKHYCRDHTQTLHGPDVQNSKASGVTVTDCALRRLDGQGLWEEENQLCRPVGWVLETRMHVQCVLLKVGCRGFVGQSLCWAIQHHMTAQKEIKRATKYALSLYLDPSLAR